VRPVDDAHAEEGAPAHPAVVPLGPGGEFDLIRRFVSASGPLPGRVLVGPGDDAAVLAGGWVVSTDVSVEGVHFRRRWLTDPEIGYRATAAALSDLAAMAAEPVGVLVSLVLPDDGAVDADALHRGIRSAAEGVGAGVIGGDVARSPGPLVIDVVVLGIADEPVSRAGARPGDEVWVSGTLGGSAAAVSIWESGGEPPPPLRRAFVHPVPRIAEARALKDRGGVRSLIDLSDGLAGDAGHLAAAGGVAIVLDSRSIPVFPGLADVVGEKEALGFALHGGEDYELCCVVSPGSLGSGKSARVAGVSFTAVGRVEEGNGIFLEDEERRTRLTRGGFSHFGEGGS